jgi:hypothetical protein
MCSIARGVKHGLPVPKISWAYSLLQPPIPDLPSGSSKRPPRGEHAPFFLNRPDQAETKRNGETTSFTSTPSRERRGSGREFKDRVKRGATAFRNPDLFPHEENEIVGILSENCVVGYLILAFESCVDGQPSGGVGACRSIWRLFIRCWPLAFRSRYSRHHRPRTS